MPDGSVDPTAGQGGSGGTGGSGGMPASGGSGGSSGDAGDDMDAGADAGDPDAGPDADVDVPDAADDAAADDAGDSGTDTTPSEQLAAVRDTADDVDLDLPVAGVYVTYLKPAIGSEDAGFFVQAEASGPAIFVALDPAELSPELEVGDRVAFTVTGLDTAGGLKQVTAISGLSVAASGSSIEPLITEVSAVTDLVSALDSYESRVIRAEGVLGVFAPAGAGFVAPPLVTVGIDDTDLRLRLPEDVSAQYDLVQGCSVAIDYGVVWRFNARAQLSVFSEADLADVDCPAPTVVSAEASDATHVRVLFDRQIAAATVTTGRITFDQGASASAVAVDGNAVNVTLTSALASGTTYTVTVAPQVTDTLGVGVATPSSAMFAFVQNAVLALNEINPNIASARDLIELLALTSGSVNGITIVQRGSATETLATLPDLTVTSGDLLVVHLAPATATGAAPGSESTTKNQYAAATFAANYDGAWDIHGGNTGLTYSNRVIEVRSAGGTLQDVTPFVVSNSASPPAAFPGSLQALQTAGQWFPIDCGGMACTYATTPSAVDVSVDYLGCATTATGNSVSRDIGGFGSIKSDWNVAAANSWGLANP